MIAGHLSSSLESTEAEQQLLMSIKIHFICLQLLMILSLWFGTPTRAMADKFEEGATSNFANIFHFFIEIACILIG